MTNKKKKMTPEIRFSGFEGDWEQRKLGEVTDSYSGGTPSANNQAYYGGNIPFIRSAEINSSQTELFLTDDGLKESSAKMVEIGNILYALYGATSGEVGISQIKGAINQAILALQPKENYDSQFIMQWLRLQKQNIIDNYLQGGQGNLSGSIVKNLEISFPNYDEQQKIGNFFKKIDDTITLHQQKLEMLRRIKQAFLQQLFPAKEENVPKVRFAHFEGVWEQRKLEETINVNSGRDYKHLNRGDIPVYGTGGYMLSVDEALSYDLDGIGIGRKGTINSPYILYAPFWTVDTLFYAIPKPFVDLNFLYSIFQKINWKKMDESTGVPSLSKVTINKVIVFFPSFEEQQKIGTFFKQIDNTITLHQQKLEMLRQLKKAYLQKMFI